MIYAHGCNLSLLRLVVMNMSGPITAQSSPVAASPAAPVSDADLAALVAQGDRVAAGVMVERHQSRIHAFLSRLTHRDDVAADLTQETLLRMLRHASRFDNRYSMPTWLLTIARRLAINHITQKSHAPFSDNTPEPAAPQADPAHAIAEKDDRHHLREKLDMALNQLTIAQRTAVVLFHQQGLSLEEVATVMELPTGTVKSHLHRGRTKMREILEENASVHRVSSVPRHVEATEES